MKTYTPPRKGDIVEAVEASQERKAAEQKPIALPVELIAGRGVRGWYTRDERTDRNIVGRREGNGPWTGQRDGAPGTLHSILNSLPGKGR